MLTGRALRLNGLPICRSARSFGRSFAAIRCPSIISPRRTFMTSIPVRSSKAATSSTDLASTKPFYLTTPIFYVNADPHIGHLYTAVLSDTLVRWNAFRHRGRSPAGSLGPAPELSGPLFCTGTDEHGLKIQRAAEEVGIPPRELCDQVSTRFRDLTNAAGVAASTFIRTTEPRHAQTVQHIWRLLQERGMIYKGEHQGWYAVSDEAFYPETQISDVKDPVTGEEYKIANESGKRVEWSSEENYKFKLFAMVPQLIEWIEKNDPIQPSQFKEKVLNELRTQGEVRDLSISRPRSRLQWGIPVPGDDQHVVYVWMDALVNYLTAAGYPGEHKSWPADVHVIGKDIVRFHTIYWPAFLMAAGIEPPRTVLVHSHWTVAGGKMSKSVGNVVDPFALLSTGAGLLPEGTPGSTDVGRYLLAKAGGSLASDAAYSPELFAKIARKDLRNQLGNLTSRMLGPKILARTVPEGTPKPSKSNPVETVIPFPAPKEEDLPELVALREQLDKLPQEFDAYLGEFRFASALDAVSEVVARNNEYVQALAPWSSTVPAEQVRTGVYWTMETLRVAGSLLSPFMPERMAVLLTTLGEAVPASSTLGAGERIESLYGSNDTWTDVCARRSEVRLTLRGEKVTPLFMIPTEGP